MPFPRSGSNWSKSANTSANRRQRMEQTEYPASNLEPYVDASEAARFLKIHPKTLMRLARERLVPAYSFNDGARHHWHFLESELDIWMRSRVNSISHPVRSVS
ncbi:MAG: hypothetical protein DMG26_06920 [Acidobacteria bacterium]|nr:MAG: hypothetical protein DMG26_06920 [Acidobacteriota bacterium]